jgi:hypothetical protein
MSDKTENAASAMKVGEVIYTPQDDVPRAGGLLSPGEVRGFGVNLIKS